MISNKEAETSDGQVVSTNELALLTPPALLLKIIMIIIVRSWYALWAHTKLINNMIKNITVFQNRHFVKLSLS